MFMGNAAILRTHARSFDHMPQRNTFSYIAILSVLTKFCKLDEALNVFKSMPEPDQCSWNAMVFGFAQQGRFEEAMKFFVDMHSEDFVLNEYSFGSALSACAGLTDLKMGGSNPCFDINVLYLLDVYMGSALVDMYS